MISKKSRKLCKGSTQKGVKCTKFCKPNTDYCNLHALKYDTTHSNMRSDVHVATHVATSLPSKKVDCSICLCELEEDRFTLICNHMYHKDCIKEWLEAGDNSDCPVCKVKIDENVKNDLNLNLEKRFTNIKITKDEEILKDEKFARELANDESIHTNTQLSDEINQAIEYSLMTFEIDEYNFLSKILEESYIFAELEDQALIDRVSQLNIEEQSLRIANETIHESIDRIMNGATSKIIKLV